MSSLTHIDGLRVENLVVLIKKDSGTSFGSETRAELPQQVTLIECLDEALMQESEQDQDG